MSHDTNYSALDRAIHRLAFASPAIQATAADIETLLFGKQFRHLRVERPIFVTSLPRAGTTLLLEILARVPGLATHSYRDMPFVLAPILWSAVSSGFRKPQELRERAHADGMDVGYDSPEAFEEILWRSSWPEQYSRDSIALWPDRSDAEFRELFLDHIRKILALRAPGSAGARYLSKNNANIARLGMLRRLFPDCTLVVPVRDPIGQAISLLQQHRRFTAMHARDPFSKRYMDDIGHLEFGELHRPILFDGMNDVRRQYRPDTLDYWVAYWEKAFRHVLRYRDEVVFVSYEALCASGPAVMPVLAGALGLPGGVLREALGDRMRPPREREAGLSVSDGALERRARVLHEELLGATALYA